MKKIASILLSLVLSNFAFADGHGHGNEFPFKYFLHTDITTDDVQATLAGAVSLAKPALLTAANDARTGLLQVAIQELQHSL